MLQKSGEEKIKRFYFHLDEDGSNPIKEAMPMRTCISKRSLEMGMVCHIWAGSRLNAYNFLGIQIILLFINSWTLGGNTWLSDERLP